MEHEFFCLGRLGSKGSKEKSGVEFFWATFRGGFFNFLWAKKQLKKKKNILATALKSYINEVKFFFEKLKKKIIYIKYDTTHVLILSVIQKGAVQTHCLYEWGQIDYTNT